MTIGNLGFVKELVNAFNVSNYSSKVNTNFVVEDDNIVVKFNCDQDSAKKYLSKMKEDLIREFFPDEYVAGHFFNLKSFPFHFDEKWLKYDRKTRMTKLIVPIDSRVIFNLKTHFAQECMVRVKARMSIELKEFGLSEKDAEEVIRQGIKSRVINNPYPYLHCVLFDSKNMQRHFVQTLQAQMNKCGYNYLDFYCIDSNEIYLKDIEDINFIRSVTEFSKKKVGYHFRFPNDDYGKVRNYKDAMGELIFSLTGIKICGYYRDSFIDEDRISNGDHFAFIPITKEGNISRYLNRDEANKINAQFGCDLLTDIKNQTETTRSGEFDGIYAFSDRQIALLIPVIIENSVINKDGQIEIDPELRFRASTPVFNRYLSPDKEAWPSSKMSQAQVRSPTGESQGKIEKKPPRQGFIGAHSALLVSKQVDVLGTSGGSLPSSKLGSIAVSYSVAGPSSSQSVNAAYVQASQPMNFSPSQFTQSGSSGSLSAQQSFSEPLRFSSSGSRFQPYVLKVDKRPDFAEQLGPFDLSRKGAAQNVQVGTSARGPGSSPPPLTPSSSNVSGSQPPAQMGSSGASSSRGAQAGANIGKEEEKLIEALLDMFNFNNYIGEIHTNFTLEDGKIVSLIYVDKREYLQKLRNYIIEKHCGIEEEARKVYDFDQFLFVFPPDSNYEEDEEVEDIAYNVSGAVFNLKIHLIQEFKRNVEYRVIKKLEKEMRITEREACECIRRSVHLEKVNNPTSYLCDISFSNEYFQNQPELSNELEIDVETLFKEFKNIYVEEFKSRLKECGLGNSLVSHEGNMLHIKNAIDIDVVKKVKKYKHKEVPVQQFPYKGVMIEVPIVLQDGSYILDMSGIPSETRPPLRQRARPIEGTSKAGKTKPEGQDSGIGSSGDTTDAGKGSSEAEEETRNRCLTSDPGPMDCKELSSTQQKSPWSEDEGSSSESSRSGSSNSSPESDGENTRIRLRKRKSPESDGGNTGTKLEKCKSSDEPLTEEEKELFKALLYAFNLNNYTFEYTHTNFIVENGKIASFIDNGVNVKEYLKELRDSTIKDYCVTEEEAYYPNEFPFEFLSNCEKNQEMTVVANISRNALLNLKKLFIQEQKQEEKVEIKDICINIVKEEVKSKKDLWVDSQVKSGKHLKVARSTRYPNESKLKDMPIVKGENGGYFLLHDYLEKKKKPRNATTTFEKNKKDDSSSGYFSGSATDAENVSSKAEEETRNRCLTSDPGPMDCKELSSTQQKSPWSEDEGSSSESSRSGSSNSSPESDGENTGTKKRKSSWSEDENSLARKSLRSESSNSSSPRSDLFDSDSELCRSLDKAGISK